MIYLSGETAAFKCLLITEPEDVTLRGEYIVFL